MLPAPGCANCMHGIIRAVEQTKGSATNERRGMACCHNGRMHSFHDPLKPNMIRLPAHLFSVAQRLPQWLAATALLGALAACAPDKPTADDAASAPTGSGTAIAVDELRAKLAGAIPDLGADAIQPSAAPGLYELRHEGFYAYITEDGRYLIQGDLVDLDTGTNLSETQRKSDRVVRLDSLGEDKMIVFAPESPKYAVTVFTDVDCGYCRKLHREIDTYLDQGIAIRYVFYPRSGPGSDSFRKAEAVWCAADRKLAMTEAKASGKADGASDCENPVQEEWQLGNALGLRGTPMLILPDGEVINGYVPADKLAEHLATVAASRG